jgi:hypothetical protein
MDARLAQAFAVVQTLHVRWAARDAGVRDAQQIAVRPCDVSVDPTMTEC